MTMPPGLLAPVTAPLRPKVTVVVLVLALNRARVFSPGLPAPPSDWPFWMVSTPPALMVVPL